MSLVRVGDEEIPLETFNQVIIQDGKTFKYNPDRRLKIEFDINNPDDLQLFGINDLSLRMICYQLGIQKEQPKLVPDEYKNKFCALFGGQVFYSFDTREELNQFKDDPKSPGLTFTYYYPN